MTSYNRTKAEDRKREIADLKDEIAAVDAGKWPRDLRDSLKILGIPFLDAAEEAAYARRVCQCAVDYLEAIPARVAVGELPE